MNPGPTTGSPSPATGVGWGAALGAMAGAACAVVVALAVACLGLIVLAFGDLESIGAFVSALLILVFGSALGSIIGAAIGGLGGFVAVATGTEDRVPSAAAAVVGLASFGVGLLVADGITGLLIATVAAFALAFAAIAFYAGMRFVRGLRSEAITRPPA